MAELVYAQVSEACAFTGLRVRVSLRPPLLRAVAKLQRSNWSIFRKRDTIVTETACDIFRMISAYGIISKSSHVRHASNTERNRSFTTEHTYDQKVLFFVFVFFDRLHQKQESLSR